MLIWFFFGAARLREPLEGAEEGEGAKKEAVAAEKTPPEGGFLQPIHLQSEETSPSEPIIHCPSSPPDPRPSVQKSLCIIHRGTSDQPRTWDREGPSLRNLNIAQWMH